jgi:dienelactone hydrolase
MRSSLALATLTLCATAGAFAGVLGYAPSAHADGGCSVDAKIVTYYKPAELPKQADTRCENKDGKCKKLELKGHLYVPPPSFKTKGPYPVLVFNHGSGQAVGGACEIGSWFAERGYVVFMPHRRGHGDSTGAYLTEYVAKQCSKPGQATFCKMEYLHKQELDVKEAVAWVKQRKDVDAKRLALAGHSYGGIATIFTNTRDLGQRAVIDFAGASQSWESDPAIAAQEMKEAVRKAVAPIFFFEPLNDASIEPTIRLAQVAGMNCKQFQSALYPAVDVDKDGSITHADYSSKRDKDGNHARDKAHGASTRMPKVWGPAAHEFLQRYFDRPAEPFDKLCKGSSLITKGED